MPSRSVLLALAVAALPALAASALPATAPARIVVIDRAGRVLATPDRAAGGDRLLGWTADGTALVVGDGEQGDVARVDVATGARTSLRARSGLVATGPADRWVAAEWQGDRSAATVTVRAADGSVLATTRLAQDFRGGDPVALASWSADGARVALSSHEELVVLDLATGSERRREPVAKAVPNVLSPDGASLLVARGDALTRIDLATNAGQALATGTAKETRPFGEWSATGRLAIFKGSRVWLDGAAVPIDLPRKTLEHVALTPDGGAVLGLLSLPPSDACHPYRGTIVAYAPGARPETIVPSFPGSVTGLSWSPDGTRAAVAQALEPEDYIERRGTRHPWPRRIATDYEMRDPRGDRAMRRAVGRLAADLRGGMGRSRAMNRFGAAMDRISRQPWGEDVRDTVVGEAIAEEVGAWLRAAGFREIDGLDELEGDAC